MRVCNKSSAVNVQNLKREVQEYGNTTERKIYIWEAKLNQQVWQICDYLLNWTHSCVINPPLHQNQGTAKHAITS